MVLLTHPCWMFYGATLCLLLLAIFAFKCTWTKQEIKQCRKVGGRRIPGRHVGGKQVKWFQKHVSRKQFGNLTASHFSLEGWAWSRSVCLHSCIAVYILCWWWRGLTTFACSIFTLATNRTQWFDCDPIVTELFNSGAQHCEIWVIDPFFGRMHVVVAPETAQVRTVLVELLRQVLQRMESSEKKQYADQLAEINFSAFLSQCSVRSGGQSLPGDCYVKELLQNPVIRIRAPHLHGGAKAWFMLVMPGNNWCKKIMVPFHVIKFLLGKNVVEEMQMELKARQFAWVPGVTIEMQWQYLLTSFPDCMQKRALQKKCSQTNSLAVTHQPTPDTSLKQVKSAATSSFDLLQNPEHQGKNIVSQPSQPDAASSFDLPKHEKSHAGRVVSQAGQPEHGIDRKFLMHAAEGQSLSREDRLKLAQHARLLKVLQKEGGKKKTNAVLAQECLSAMSASNTVVQKNSQPPLPQADAKASTRQGTKRCFQSGPEPLNQVDGSNVDCSHSLPETIFLQRASAGHSLKPEERKRLAQYAKTLKVTQKKGSHKKNNMQLAEDCLKKISAKNNIEDEALPHIESNKKIRCKKKPLLSKRRRQNVKPTTESLQQINRPIIAEGNAKALMQSVMQGVPVDKYEGRKNLAKQAKQLGVKQFSGGKKTTQRDLASNCSKVLAGKRQQTLPFVRSVKPKLVNMHAMLTEEEQKNKFWNKVTTWVSNEIQNAKVKNLEHWVFSCGYCALDAGGQLENLYREFLHNRLLEIVSKEKSSLEFATSTVKDTAATVKELMQKLTMKEKAYILVVR